MSNLDGRLVGLWGAAEGTLQFSANDTAVVDGQMFRYTADGRLFTLIGINGMIQLPYQLDGDSLTYVVNGRTIRARRIPETVIADLARAVQRGAGVWVGTESSLDPSLYISWTQYVVLYPDGSVDYATSDSGAQVAAYTGQFIYSHETGPYQARMGRWQGDGVNMLVQWNTGAVWRGRADIARGQLVFFGIGNLETGSNVSFERQPLPIPAVGNTVSDSVADPAGAPIGASQSANLGDSSRVQQPPTPEDSMVRLFTAWQALQVSGVLDPASHELLAALINDPQQLAALADNTTLLATLINQLEMLALVK